MLYFLSDCILLEPLEQIQLKLLFLKDPRSKSSEDRRASNQEGGRNKAIDERI